VAYLELEVMLADAREVSTEAATEAVGLVVAAVG
jgi:hypothetical protein